MLMLHFLQAVDLTACMGEMHIQWHLSPGGGANPWLAIDRHVLQVI